MSAATGDLLGRPFQVLAPSLWGWLIVSEHDNAEDAQVAASAFPGARVRPEPATESEHAGC